MTSYVHKATTLDGRVMLYGNTYPHREAIRGAGGKWDATDKAWYLPAGTELSFLPADALYVPYVPKPMPVARSRDGRCCAHAEAYWPNTGPYSHYDPPHFRCATHGECRSTYSGT
jgi:hypothetical protein